MLARLIGLLIAVMTVASPTHAAFDHGAWDGLLKAHVGAASVGNGSRVDYDGMNRDRAALGAYLRRLSAVEADHFNAWEKNDRLAFLINAYNAWTVDLILRHWPDVQSIRDLGSLLRSPWDKRFIPLLGRTRTLDEIEHRMIRADGVYREPRIHFAVNCASIGCPPLRAEAYTGIRLDAQLEDATRNFLADRSQNHLAGTVLHVSSIFTWYRADFEKGWGGFDKLETFLIAYQDALGLDAQAVSLLRAGDMRIRFSDYDWRLNKAC